MGTRCHRLFLAESPPICLSDSGKKPAHIPVWFWQKVHSHFRLFLWEKVRSYSCLFLAESLLIFLSVSGRRSTHIPLWFWQKIHSHPSLILIKSWTNWRCRQLRHWGFRAQFRPGKIKKYNTVSWKWGRGERLGTILEQSYACFFSTYVLCRWLYLKPPPPHQSGIFALYYGFCRNFQ